MERQSSQHSPRVDDEMAREVASLVHGAPVEARSEESRTFEGPADGEPVPEAVLTEVDEIQQRSELARRLRPSIFPANRAALVQCALDEHAPDDLIAALGQIPNIEYHTTNEVWVAMGGDTEQRFEEHGQPEPFEPHVSRSSPVQRFGFRFDWRYRIAAIPFGITPGRAFVELDWRRDPAVLRAQFGFWGLETPLSNVAGSRRSGPYALPKTIGPPHLSLGDRGLTFATTNTDGLCIEFVEPVKAIDPFGVVRHPALTITVDDPDALEHALRDAEGAGNHAYVPRGESA